jgi:hypothetical protein
VPPSRDRTEVTRGNKSLKIFYCILYVFSNGSNAFDFCMCAGSETGAVHANVPGERIARSAGRGVHEGRRGLQRVLDDRRFRQRGRPERH